MKASRDVLEQQALWATAEAVIDAIFAIEQLDSDSDSETDDTGASDAWMGCEEEGEAGRGSVSSLSGQGGRSLWVV